MGFGSISQTLKNAKEQDPSDPSTVWMWIIVCEKRPTKQIRRYRGSNSYTNDKREAKTICCDRAIILSSFIIYIYIYRYIYMAVCQNLVPLVNIKIAGKWMFIPLKMVLIGIDPYPYIYILYMIIRVSFFMYFWD